MLLSVRHSPIQSFSAVSKNQPAHFSRSQPRPICSKRTGFAAIISGSDVHYFLTTQKINILALTLSAYLTMKFVRYAEEKSGGTISKRLALYLQYWAGLSIINRCDNQVSAWCIFTAGNRLTQRPNRYNNRGSSGVAHEFGNRLQRAGTIRVSDQP
jgi:hypothetical protein